MTIPEEGLLAGARLNKLIFAVAAGGTITAGWWRGWQAAGGFALGAAVSWVNYRWLARTGRCACRPFILEQSGGLRGLGRGGVGGFSWRKARCETWDGLCRGCSGAGDAQELDGILLGTPLFEDG